jgi:hypothetical protein
MYTTKIAASVAIQGVCRESTWRGGVNPTAELVNLEGEKGQESIGSFVR